jgi:hypothetical protein
MNQQYIQVVECLVDYRDEKDNICNDGSVIDSSR